MDWNEIARVVSDWHATHGTWLSYDQIIALQGAPTPQPTAAPPTPTASTGYAYPAANDWNGIGALVSAFHDATGRWASLDEIIQAGWTPGGATPTPPTTTAPQQPAPPMPPPPPAPAELLHNAGFETGDAVWWDDWSHSGHATGPLGGGSHAYGFGTGGQGGMSQGFALHVPAGSHFALSFDAQVAGAPAYAGVRFYDAQDHEVLNTQLALPAGTAHQALADLVLPAEAVGGYVWFWKDNGTSLSVDNVSLTQTAGGTTPDPLVVAPQAYPGLTPLLHPEKMGLGIAAQPWDIHAASIEALHPSWTYDWTATPNSGADTGFVPMIWGASQVSPGYLQEAAKYGTILGFNEPDSVSQANMSVQQALDLWPQLEATGARLGSPATVTALNGWEQDFMSGAEARGLRVDFVTVHYYANDLDVGKMQWFLQTVHDTYHKPVWVTEWAPADWSNLGSYSEDQMADYLYRASKMMDGLDFVEKQSWFSAYEGADGLHGWHNFLIGGDGQLTKVGETFAALLGH